VFSDNLQDAGTSLSASPSVRLSASIYHIQLQLSLPQPPPPQPQQLLVELHAANATNDCIIQKAALWWQQLISSCRTRTNFPFNSPRLPAAAAGERDAIISTCSSYPNIGPDATLWKVRKRQSGRPIVHARVFREIILCRHVSIYLSIYLCVCVCVYGLKASLATTSWTNSIHQSRKAAAAATTSVLDVCHSTSTTTTTSIDVHI